MLLRNVILDVSLSYSIQVFWDFELGGILDGWKTAEDDRKNKKRVFGT